MNPTEVLTVAVQAALASGLIGPWIAFAILIVGGLLFAAAQVWPVTVVDLVANPPAPAFPLEGGEPGRAGSLPLDQRPPDSYL